MKKLIFRKFILDITLFFLISSLSITLIVWVIQAVNYLDFVSEDGHSFKVYFVYSLLNLPKIFSKIVIFLFFISCFYTVSKYEENNEILIFWTNGIKKTQFINNIIKFSIIVFILQFVLIFFVVPKTLDLARSQIRNSNIDYFPSLIKSKQFIDTVSDLTIFVDKKKNNGLLKNIFLKDEKFDSKKSKIISAKEGAIIKKRDDYYLILYDGQITNLDKKNTNIFTFDKTEINLSNYTSKSILHPKIQELSSFTLLKCLLSFINNNSGYSTKTFDCNLSSITPTAQELFKRTIIPIYILIVGFVASCLIIKSKNEKNYNIFKYSIFFIGIICILLSEVTIQLISYQNFENLFIATFPYLLSLLIYFYLIISPKFYYK